MSLDAFTQAFAGTDWDRLAAAARAVPAVRPAPAGAASGLAAGDAPARAEQDEPFITFKDVFDAINPINQIPIIDGIYRHYTGDVPRPQASIMGGLLYGGLVGGAIASGMVLVKEALGVDPEDAMIALILGDDNADGAVETASAQPATAEPAGQPGAQPESGPAAAQAAPAGSGRQQAQTQQAQTQQAQTQQAQASSAVAASNQAALQRLAMDLAAGGRMAPGASAAAAPAAPPPSAPAQAPAGALAALSAARPANPLIQGALGNQGAMGNGQSRPARMPSRGMVASNPNPPPGLYGPGHRFASFSQPVAMVAASPNRAAGLPAAAGAAQAGSAPAGAAAGTAPVGAAPAGAAPAGAAAVAPAALPVRAGPPAGSGVPQRANQPVWGGTGPAIRSLASSPDARPLSPAQPPPVLPLDPAEPITASPPVPPVALGPADMSQMMMRNLEKYQSMSRGAQRPAAAASVSG